MIRLLLHSFDGTPHPLQGLEGQSVLDLAVQAGVVGIDGDCGGQLTCATCHVIVDPEWRDRLPPPVPDETDMLDFAASPAGPGSRLACQLRLSMALDGLSLRLPRSQY